MTKSVFYTKGEEEKSKEESSTTEDKCVSNGVATEEEKAAVKKENEDEEMPEADQEEKKEEERKPNEVSPELAKRADELLHKRAELKEGNIKSAASVALAAAAVKAKVFYHYQY